ncbi:MAG: hypothetical protein LIO74_10100 [Ruminococcus sp.]|nr:hypothetical protein [Ruminococcus sp.]
MNNNCVQKEKIKVLIGSDAVESGLKCASTLRCPEIYAYTRKRDGKIILDTIQKEYPDVVIMGVTMPHFDALGVI